MAAFSFCHCADGVCEWWRRFLAVGAEAGNFPREASLHQFAKGYALDVTTLKLTGYIHVWLSQLFFVCVYVCVCVCVCLRPCTCTCSDRINLK